MQKKVASKLPSWETTKTQSKKGFDKVWGWADKLGAPVNRLSNRIGSEAFWPTTLDKESDKAARILRSFCKDGFYTEEETPAAVQGGPKQKQRVVKKIPQRVIERAVGLAIFTTMRTGLWVSGAGGSGVLIARNEEDGSWSPPSGILLHTAGLGFLVGVDIYDCVLVINNRKALASFTKIRATLGGEISAVAGPVGAGGVLENDGKWKEANRPVFTYLKSRGFYAGVQVDGTIIIERTDENKRFYGEPVSAADILAGNVRHRPPALRMLMETLKAAEGRTDVDAELMEELEGQPPPGDVNVEEPGANLFGVPDPEDPDPYGVLALEKEGLEIRDAATHSRPSSQLFAFNPSPTSPVYNSFHFSHRRSMSINNAASNRWSLDRRPYTAADMSTQTDPVLILPHPDADAETLPAEGAQKQKDGSTLSPNSPPPIGLGLDPPDEEDEARSIYEDVPDALSPEETHEASDASPFGVKSSDPWSSDPSITSPYGDDSAPNGTEDVDEKAKETAASDEVDTDPTVSATESPPILSPSTIATKTEGFDDVSLGAGDKEK